MRLYYYLLVILLFCSLVAASYAPEEDPFAGDPFHKGDARVFLSKTSINAGETLDISVDLTNSEPYPISDGILTLAVAQTDNDMIPFPSQVSDDENYVYEFVETKIKLWPNSKVSKTYSYILPEDLKEGPYRVDAFFRTDKTPISGIWHILLQGNKAHFFVNGTGKYSSSKILRTKTYIDNPKLVGPTGPPFAPGSNVDLHVFLKNPIDSSKLQVTVCPWHDDGCPSEIFKQSYPVSTRDTKVVIPLNVPKAPDSYAIKIEYLDKNNRLLSLYKSRMVSEGDGAKIRKMVIDTMPLKSGKLARLKVAVAGSADHYSFPVTKDTVLYGSVKDLDTGKVLLEEKTNLPPLDTRRTTYVTKIFEFIPEVSSSNFEVCSRIDSASGQTYDSGCYVIDASKFPLDKYSFNHSFSWNANQEVLTFNLCIEDSFVKEPFSIEYFFSGGSLQRMGDATLDPCADIQFKPVSKGEYSFDFIDPLKSEQIQIPVKVSQKSDLPSPVVELVEPEVKKKLWIVEKKTAIAPLLVLLIIVLCITMWVWRHSQK